MQYYIRAIYSIFLFIKVIASVIVTWSIFSSALNSNPCVWRLKLFIHFQVLLVYLCYHFTFTIDSLLQIPVCFMQRSRCVILRYNAFRSIFFFQVTLISRCHLFNCVLYLFHWVRFYLAHLGWSEILNRCLQKWVRWQSRTLFALFCSICSQFVVFIMGFITIINSYADRMLCFTSAVFSASGTIKFKDIWTYKRF